MSKLVRVIIHWTAGGSRANALDKKHYHRLVEYDGTIVAGNEEIADNIVTSDGDYAAHTRNLNTGSIGVAMCGMHGAKESPFDPGASPLTEKQFNAMCILVSDLCRQHSIPVTRETVLTHAEVEPILGVKQRGKWDITRLPFKPDLVGAIPVGDYIRDRIKQVLGDTIITPTMPTLRMGNSAPLHAVKQLQRDLADRGYHQGRVDGLFGPRTRDSVLAFQADNGLVTDGIVGPQTWAAFRDAEAKPERDVREEDLQESRTMKAAEKGDRALVGTQVGVGGTVGVGAVTEAIGAAERAEGFLETAQRLLEQYWFVLLIALAAFLLARYGRVILREIREYRVEDARKGKHLGR